jgi:hypothetical protein
MPGPPAYGRSPSPRRLIEARRGLTKSFGDRPASLRTEKAPARRTLVGAEEGNPPSLLRQCKLAITLITHGAGVLRQLGDVGGDAPGLVAGVQVSDPPDARSSCLVDPFKVVRRHSTFSEAQEGRDEVPPQPVATQTYQPAATDNVPDVGFAFEKQPAHEQPQAGCNHSNHNHEQKSLKQAPNLFSRPQWKSGASGTAMRPKSFAFYRRDRRNRVKRCGAVLEACRSTRVVH